MIMHIITNFTASAGAETMLARLLRNAGGERVIVVSLIDISERNTRLSNNPAAEYVALHMRSLTAVPAVLVQLKRLIQRERPNTIVCWMYHAMVVGTIALKWAGCNASLYWNVRQSLDDLKALTRSMRVAIRAARPLSRRADGIIYNSSRARMLHTAYGFADRNAITIANGFDLPPLVPLKPRKAKTFGIAARFHRQKDHATFFRAAAQVLATHPDARFVAVGKGLSWQNPDVAALVRQAGVGVYAIELRDEVAEMGEFYQSIDALVLSSRTEGFPNVIAEAMSYGRPIVTTDVGDAAAIVEEAGFVVPPRNATALADAMRKILDLSPEDYADYSQKARVRIERHFSLDTVLKDYRAFLNSECGD